MDACKYYDIKGGSFLSETVKGVTRCLYSKVKDCFSEANQKKIEHIGKIIEDIDMKTFYYSSQMEYAGAMLFLGCLPFVTTGCGGGGGGGIFSTPNEITTRDDAIKFAKEALNSRSGNVQADEYLHPFPNQHGHSYRIGVFDLYGPGNTFQNCYLAVGPVGVEERKAIAWLNDPDNDPATPVDPGHPVLLLVPIESYEGNETITGFKNQVLSDAMDLEKLTARDTVD